MRRAEAAKAVLEFYAHLGVERLPLELPEAKSRPVLEPIAVREPADARPADKTPHKGKAAALIKLREEIGDCRRCKLFKGRTHIVFGEGNPGAKLMFIGEGPGREEDLEGRPFVGDAGRLLTRLITKMGMGREEVYIGNIIKCRPPGNRDPDDDEVAACIPFITRQIEIISPKVIMALGRHAAHALAGTKIPITRMRGNFVDYRGMRLMPTFHPAYLLRNPKDKELVWQDALKVLAILGRRPA